MQRAGAFDSLNSCTNLPLTFTVNLCMQVVQLEHSRVQLVTQQRRGNCVEDLS